MNQTLAVQEFAIVIAAKNHNPTVLNPDFLKYSGIVPTDWELARPPVYTNRVAQLTFQNGITIVAEPNRVLFLEAIVDKTPAPAVTPAIARKYVQTLPNIDYQAVGINFRSHLAFENQSNAHKYLTEKLLSPGVRHEEGIAPVVATVNFTYKLERSPLNLNIREAMLQLSDKTTTPIVLFTGTFNYDDIASKAGNERLSSLYQAISYWQADLEIYKDIVNTKFLAASTFNTASLPEVLPITA